MSQISGKALAESMISGCKRIIGEACSKLSRRIDAIEHALTTIPTPKDGRDGRDGTDGRDAMDLEILTAIDAAKSYPRGTYAIHGGGILRSFKTTSPIGSDPAISGWEVLVDGIEDVSVEQKDERNFMINVSRTSGKKTTKTFYVPAQIYRGVYREEKEYQRGDTVTHSGSQWTAIDENVSSSPGSEKSGWRLSVKKGVDARELREAQSGAK